MVYNIVVTENSALKSPPFNVGGRKVFMYTFKKSSQSKDSYFICEDDKIVGKALANPYRVYHSTIDLSPTDRISLQLFAKKYACL